MERDVNLRILILIITLAGLAVYANSFSGDFIWDDYPLVLNNYLIQSWHNLPQIFTSDLYKVSWGKTNFYRPLVSLSFVWDYWFWGKFTFGYHLTNVALHLLNAFLAFLILNKITKQKIVSFWASLLFLIHPISPPVVSYISGRADSLAVFFILLSSLCLLIWDEKGKPIYYLVSIFSFIFSLLSKEIALIFPFLLLVYTIHFVGRSKRQFFFFLPFFLLTFVYIGLRCTVLDFRPHSLLLTKFSLLERLISTPRIILNYFQVLLFPFNLHMEKTLAISKSLLEPNAYISFFIVILLGFSLFLLYRKNRIISFGLGWFLLALFPTLGILPLNATVADHWAYLPSLGFFLAFSMAVSLLKKRTHNFVFIPICLILAVVTIHRNSDWSDEFTFYKRTLAKAPHSARLHEALGTFYAQKGFSAQAIKEYQEAIKLKPDIFQAHFNLGAMYQKFSLYPQAEEEYKKTLQLYADFPEAHNNLGVIYFYQKNYQSAINEYNKAVELRPDYAQAYNNRGAVYASLGDMDKAREDWQKALKIKPDYQSPKLNLEAYTK